MPSPPLAGLLGPPALACLSSSSFSLPCLPAWLSQVGGSLEPGEDLLLRRRMTRAQLLALCRHFCLCPGLLPRKHVLAAFQQYASRPDFLLPSSSSSGSTASSSVGGTAASSLSAAARYLRRRHSSTASWSSSTAGGGHSRQASLSSSTGSSSSSTGQQRPEEEGSLGFSGFRDWLAVVAVGCEWFRRQDGSADAPTRLHRFLSWLDAAPHSDRLYHWAHRHQTRPGPALPKGGLRSASLLNMMDGVLLDG